MNGKEASLRCVDRRPLTLRVLLWHNRHAEGNPLLFRTQIEYRYLLEWPATVHDSGLQCELDLGGMSRRVVASGKIAEFAQPSESQRRSFVGKSS